MNSVKRTIKVMKEVETKRRTVFLDVLISREKDGTIMAEVYRKPAHTGQYLNYHSYGPLEHKEAAGIALFRRVKNHFGNLAKQYAEEQRTVQEMKMNGYLKKKITTIKKKAQQKKKRAGNEK